MTSCTVLSHRLTHDANVSMSYIFNAKTPDRSLTTHLKSNNTKSYLSPIFFQIPCLERAGKKTREQRSADIIDSF